MGLSFLLLPANCFALSYKSLQLTQGARSRAPPRLGPCPALQLFPCCGPHAGLHLARISNDVFLVFGILLRLHNADPPGCAEPAGEQLLRGRYRNSSYLLFFRSCLSKLSLSGAPPGQREVHWASRCLNTATRTLQCTVTLATSKSSVDSVDAVSHWSGSILDSIGLDS